MSIEKIRIAEELEQYLDTKDIVRLVDILGAKPMTDMLCASDAVSGTEKKLVIMSTANYAKKPGNHIYMTVMEEEMKVLLDVYRSYEASDHLVLLSDSRVYGSMWNYVSNGLLSIEDMFDAMLA